jgi:DNA-binding CsgD family transcriptional regulator
MPTFSLMQHALDHWRIEQPDDREKLNAFAKALEPLCGGSTNLYVFDMRPDSPLLFGMEALAENVDMKGLRPTLGGYPDQDYIRRDVIPHYLAAKETGEAGRLSLTSRIQDYVAVYDRLILPVAEHGSVRWAVTLTRTRALVPVDEKPALTERQEDIIQLLASGLSSKEIALRLGISPRTVEHQIEAAKRKLGARNIAHAVAIAMGRAFIGPGS